MNQTSSRSHAIFTVTVECSEKGPDGEHHVRVGKLHLVDLAVSFCLIYGFQSTAMVISGFLFYVTSTYHSDVMTYTLGCHDLPNVL